MKIYKIKKFFIHSIKIRIYKNYKKNNFSKIKKIKKKFKNKTNIINKILIRYNKKIQIIQNKIIKTIINYKKIKIFNNKNKSKIPIKIIRQFKILQKII